MPLGEPGLEAEHGETLALHQESQDPIAQGTELADVVVVLADRHDPRIADHLAERLEIAGVEWGVRKHRRKRYDAPFPGAIDFSASGFLQVFGAVGVDDGGDHVGQAEVVAQRRVPRHDFQRALPRLCDHFFVAQQRK